MQAQQPQAFLQDGVSGDAFQLHGATRPHHKRAETFAIPSSSGNMTAAGDPSHNSANLIDLNNMAANALANGYQTARSTTSSGP